MTFKEYMKKALKTANLDIPENDKRYNFAFGIVGEVGELIDYLKKMYYHGHEYDQDFVVKEAGDVLYYTAVLSSVCEAGLEKPSVVGDLAEFQRGIAAYIEERAWEREEQIKETCLRLAQQAGNVAEEAMFHCLVPTAKPKKQKRMQRELVVLLEILTRLLTLLETPPLTMVAQKNNEKLAKRYPAGFESERSINRDV